MNINKKNCSSKEHENIIAIIFCPKCEIYMCNKCETFHSKLCKNHKNKNLNEELEKNFSGFCKEENHNDELEFFCKTHNKLCCAACMLM